MRELLTHLPILVVGASLLSAAVVGGVVYSPELPKKFALKHRHG